MYLDLMRETASVFSVPEQAENVTALRIWHCKYKSLKALSVFKNLEELMIAGYPDSSLEVLQSLKKLKFLSILHMPKISDLAALAGLDNVETLSLATSPAWDAAGKRTTIDSLEPVAEMASLKHLELLGVCPPDKSLAALVRCTGLQTARFSQYPLDEVERFYSTTKAVNQFNPKSKFFNI
ncbi:hypothetical protein JCM19000A_32180 [Silvimonas sp. JCM 19000]